MIKKKKYKLKYQLIFAIIMTLILPTFFMQTATHIITKVVMNKKINMLVNANLSKNKQNIDLLFKNYITMVGTLSADYQIINYLHSIYKLNKEDMIEDEIKEKLYLAAFMSNEVRSVTIMTRNKENISYYKKDMDFSTALYEDICEASKKVPTTIAGTIPYGENNEEQSYIYMARQIMDLNTLEYLGTIIVCIDPSPIYELSYNHEASEYSTSFIMSPEKQIIISQNKDDIGRYVLEDEMKQISKYKIQSHSMGLRYFKWELVWFVDQKLVMAELTHLGYITLIANIVFLIGMIINIIFVSNKLIKPIPKLIKAMEEVQDGNFNIRIPVSSNNEIRDMEEKFNYMASRIYRLIKKNNAQYEQLIVATKKIKESEIKVLEAQINPHFLYNTLDSINWMAIEKDEHEISLMLNNLAKILRYTISNINRVVTVNDEIDWLSQYLYLQKQRFVTVFDYKIEAKAEIYSYRIYKLLIQPLIENAIMHGFEGYKGGGVLKIEFKVVENDYIKIEIADNGRGIDKENMDKIQEILEESNIENIEDGIGIANVINRVRLYYGKEGKIFVDSNEKGTVFTLILPNIEKDNEFLVRR